MFVYYRLIQKIQVHLSVLIALGVNFYNGLYKSLLIQLQPIQSVFIKQFIF